MTMKKSNRDRRAGGWKLFAGVLLLAAAGCETPSPMLRQQAIDALEVNDVKTADNRVSRALKQDEADWKALYLLGKVRIRQNRPVDAQLALEKSLTLRGQWPEAQDILDAMAEAIYMQNNPAALTAMLQKAADDYGGVRSYTRQGKYLGKIGDIDGAKLAFRKAMRFREKTDAEPFIQLAELLESVGDNKGAIENLKYAYFILPKSPRIEAKFRKLGIVPGPTVMVEPPKE